MGKYVVGITGASGAPYAKKLIRYLILKSGYEVHCIISEAGQKILEVEECAQFKGGIRTTLLDWLEIPTDSTHRFINYEHKNIGAQIASGSFKCDGMVIVPCSGGTLARVANGVSSDLIERAADVFLKEGRKLILVPRETPISLIHIKNMLAAKEAGAIILPASPGFYHSPKTIDDLIAMVVSRILNSLDIKNTLQAEWGGI